METSEAASHNTAQQEILAAANTFELLSNSDVSIMLHCKYIFRSGYFYSSVIPLGMAIFTEVHAVSLRQD